MATKHFVIGILLCSSFEPLVQADDRIDNPRKFETLSSLKSELLAVNDELQQIQDMTRNNKKDIHSKEGVKLSSFTTRSLRLNLQRVDGAVFNVSKKSLIKSGNKQGIYRVRDGYYKFLPAYILVNDKNRLKILVNGVHHGDQVVLNSAKLQVKKTKNKK
jgi:hypothetical protein